MAWAGWAAPLGSTGWLEVSPELPPPLLAVGVLEALLLLDEMLLGTMGGLQGPRSGLGASKSLRSVVGGLYRALRTADDELRDCGTRIDASSE